MKRITLILLTAIILAICSCKPKQAVPRSGDLVFVAIPADYSLDTADMSSGIAEATSDGEDLNYIHVAILEVEGDSSWIIDATIKHGVDRHPLDTFISDFTLRDGSLPTFEVMRIKGGPRDMVAKAKEFVGRPYDMWFDPDNEAKYCTELVRDSYLDAKGQPIFEAAPMNFKGSDGEFPVYWKQLFELLGAPIPQDVMGTNPHDMRESSLLEFVSNNLK